MSSSECRICKWISPNYEGCDVTSTNPVCDGNKDATGITKTYDSDKTAQCLGCKKDGKYLSGESIIYIKMYWYMLILLRVSKTNLLLQFRLLIK